MAGSRAIGSTLTLKGINGASDVTIAHLTSIGEIGLENEEIDVTDLDSPDDFKEYIAGSRDAGEVSLSGNLVEDSVISTIYNLADTREIVPWEVTYPTGAKWGFNAFVKSFKDGEKTPDGLLTFSSGLRVSGKPTFTMSNNSSSNNASQGG
jgi:predicted secreted protein